MRKVENHCSRMYFIGIDRHLLLELVTGWKSIEFEEENLSGQLFHISHYRIPEKVCQPRTGK